MTSGPTRAANPLRDVLYELSLAKDIPDAALLDDFVRRYPEYAAEITEFAINLAVDALQRDEAFAPPQAGMSPAVGRAISRFHNALYTKQRRQAADKASSAALAGPAENPFAALSRDAFRQLAKDLGANSVFVCKLRDRQVDPTTMTPGFISFVAEKLRRLPAAIAAYFAAEPVVNLLPQFFKADTKPEAKTQQSFEEAVRTSGLTEEQQRGLLSL